MDSTLESAQPIPPRAVQYAPFSTRAFAHLIDGLVFGFIVWVVPGKVQYLSILLAALYYPALEGSAVQATIGKRLMSLIVTDEFGDRISTRASFIRFGMSFVSSLVMMAGYFFYFFTERKQTLHDLVAGTVVLSGRSEDSLPESWIAQIKSWFS